jgi:hypothetical protein
VLVDRRAAAPIPPVAKEERSLPRSDFRLQISDL